MKSVLLVALSLVLLVGGIAIMGVAPTLTAWQGLTFVGGIVCVALAFAIPLTAR